uniref:hypothetical protein n=1 Tax=Bacteroides acidifaciens TaxID=85831 RepID=UPI0025A5471B
MNYIKNELKEINDTLFLILEWRFANSQEMKNYWMNEIFNKSIGLFDQRIVLNLRIANQIDTHFINMLEQFILEKLELEIGLTYHPPPQTANYCYV